MFKGDAPRRISLWYTRFAYANFLRLMSQPTQDSSATAPDTIITTLHTGGMNFCTFFAHAAGRLAQQALHSPAHGGHRRAGSLQYDVRQLLRQLCSSGQRLLAIPPAMCKNFLMVSPPSFYTSR
ncbi:MAG: hypothetical protein ACLUS6_00495 [Dysosmobacter sp.]